MLLKKMEILLSNKRFIMFLYLGVVLNSFLYHHLVNQNVTKEYIQLPLFIYASVHAFLFFLLFLDEKRARKIILLFSYLKVILALIMLIPYLGVYLALMLHVGIWYTKLNPLSHDFLRNHYYVFYILILIFQIFFLVSNKRYSKLNHKNYATV